MADVAERLQQFQEWTAGHYADWLAGLTQEQRTALNLYKGADFMKVNLPLREGVECIHVPMCSAISEAVAQAPARGARTVVERYIADRRIRTDIELLTAAAEAIDQQVPYRLRDRGFASTSAVEGLLDDQMVSRHGASNLIKLVGPVEDSIAAAPLELVRSLPSEAELLLERGVTFKADASVTDPRGVLVLTGNWQIAPDA